VADGLPNTKLGLIAVTGRQCLAVTSCSTCPSVGGNPYSTDNIDEHFVDKLKRGYRLDKPTYASDIMYVASCLFWYVLLQSNLTSNPS